MGRLVVLAAPSGAGKATLAHALGAERQEGGVSGSGPVSGPGIACPGYCSQCFPFGAQVARQATPGGGQLFLGWSGACSGTGACNLNMSTDRSVTDVCFDVGFGSLGTFSRTFHEIVGESPTGFRQKGRMPAVPTCFMMAWARPSSFGEARARAVTVQ